MKKISGFKVYQTNKDTTELCLLAQKYKADKFGKHNYTPYYYDLFKDRKDSVKKVVEIGTGEGASLFMWHEFFPNAKIYGADIDPDRVSQKDLKKFPRITIHECDQRSERDMVELIKNVGTDIDLFLDDGSHKPEDQLYTCLFMMPMLSPESIYIIEDVADLSVAEKIEDYFVEVIKFSKRYDDQIIVVKHHD